MLSNEIVDVLKAAQLAFDQVEVPRQRRVLIYHGYVFSMLTSPDFLREVMDAGGEWVEVRGARHRYSEGRVYTETTDA